MSGKSCILVFARAPIHGQVKTRLIPALGKEEATSLYIQMIEQTLETATSLPDVEVQLWCEPDDTHEYFTQCQQRYRITTRVQKGDDLGARMCHAISSALLDADHVIIIGTDCPGFTVRYLANAIRVLEQGTDAVLGPAADGGYVLLGVRRGTPQLFNGIAWGVDTVLEHTRQRMRNLGWKWQELAVLRDIDRPEDLPYFYDIMRVHTNMQVDSILETE